MKTRKYSLIFIVMLALLASHACSGELDMPASPMPPELPETLAAKTWSAMQTSAALSATATPTLIPPSDTPQPSNTPTITNTPTATRTQVPLLTAIPTNTPQPTSTPTLIPSLTPYSGGGSGGGTSGGGGTLPIRPCYSARLVRDITIPPGQIMLPNQHFTKVWRIENTGSCIWDKRIKFVPTGSNPFSDDSVSLPSNVRPGKTIDLAVNLISPDSNGTYTGKWYLFAETERFGDGGDDNPFKVVVEVQASLPSVMFNFAEHMCLAEWQSNARMSSGKVILISGSTSLSCQGKSGNPLGYDRKIDSPEMETGSETGPAILSSPPKIEDGEIEGIFPAMLIQSGDHFVAQLGCRDGDDDCNVRFELTLKIITPPNNITSQNTEGWHQVYDGSLTSVDIDLSGFAGKYLQFVFRVRANNNSDENRAHWVRPLITH